MKALPCTSRLEPVFLPENYGRMHTDPEGEVIRRTRSELLKRLESAPAGAVVPLHFGEVELSASCHAAILGPVLFELIVGRLRGRMTMGIDPTGRNAWDADAGLLKESEKRQRKLVCVWSGVGEGLEVVGPVDEQVRATYKFVAARCEEGATARELAEQFQLSIQAASNRLAKTADLGLLQRLEKRTVTGGGLEHVYAAVM